MPSTVKVRVKAARNLPLPERGNTVVSRGSGSGGGAGGGGNSSNIGNSLLHSPILQPPQSRDPYVVVSLGGHAAAIASALEDPSSMGKSSGSTSKADIIAASRPGYEARTKVCRRTTMPVWDEEFRFDCSDDTLLGFVEELVVADDPEFEWNETIRRSRVSHEARQTLLYLLDSCVRRRMCKTVLEMGGNAVLGYHQNFDVEGDSGIVARTYGTCVLLERKRNMPLRALTSASSSPANHEMQLTNQDRIEGLDLMMLDSMPPSPSAPDSAAGLSNRLLLSDALLSDAAAAVVARHRENSDEDEVKLLTLREFDSNVRVRFGGMVTARSVKYLGNLASKLSDQETRDCWWTELRDEIRAHAKILCCSHIIGYLEASTIHDDVAVLSITGTAATVRGFRI
jgi:C2 domain